MENGVHGSDCKEAEELFSAEEVSSADEFTKTEDWFLEVYGKNRAHPIKTLLGLYKGHYGKFLLAGLFFLIKHSPVWGLPIVTAHIIDAAIAGKEDGASTIFFNVCILLLLIALNYPLNYLYTKCRSTAVRYVEAGLRGALVRKLQQLSISCHKEMQSGRLQSKIMRDVEAIETLSSQVFVSLLNILLNLSVAFAVTISKSRVVFVFFLVTVPAAALTIVGFRKKIRASNSEFRKEMEETSAKVMEMVELIPVTRAHALEQEEIEKMEAQLNRAAKRGYRLDIVQANFGAVGWCVFQAFQVLCLGFTGILAWKGAVSAGEIALYQSYFTTIVNQVSNLITLLPTIAKGTESVTSVGEVLLAHDIERNKGKRKIKNVRGEFEFRGVEFGYEEERQVLRGFDLHVKEGETVAFVGESGAGKSTLLNLIIGFYMPQKGQVLLDGEDMAEMNLRSYRKYLAVVPQTPILFSGTIRDNITYGQPSVTDGQLLEAVRAANLEEWLKSLPEGLDTRVGEHGGKLSGGQRQRISIARALIRSPRVIVLDEATSALDSLSEKEIQKALGNLTKGRTTFVVAHRLSTVRNADRIVVVGDGVCKECGTYEELMEKKGEFYEMRRLQLE